ncbi:MAG: argininosuccinate lyase [Steroidobacteraceae bacterium]
MTRLWDKGKPLDARVLAYTAGEDHLLDARLVAHDVRASIAHARMLAGADLVSADDCEAICSALAEIGAAHQRGEWQIGIEDEDCHTALERRLTARIGAAGARVHLGRSRNDQVLTALRLYMREEVAALAGETRALSAALRALAARQGDIVLPGYTHMQQAMPSSVALWSGGFASELDDDAAGIEAVLRRIERSPLGSAAGYGAAGLPIDREATRAALGFTTVHEPVTAVQLSRGKAEAQLLFEASLLMTDLGRLAQDVLLFYTQEFAFITLGDAFTTGSSIMPQKRNPDLFELIRGNTAVAQACLVEVLGIIGKLSSGYQRDLQLLKRPLFRGIDLARATLDVLPAAIESIRFQAQNIHLDPGIHAAAEAYRLVLDEGIPFREAYRRVAAGQTGKAK